MLSPEERFFRGTNLMGSSLGKKKQGDDLTLLEQNVKKQYTEYDAKQPNHLDYVDIYGSKEVNKDTINLEDIKKNEQPPTERGKLLERIIFEEGKKSGWFGEDVSLVAVSDFDDHFSHGDIILEMKNEEGKIFRILMDVTSGVDEITLKKKLKRGANNATTGTMSQAKYSYSNMEKLNNEFLRGRIQNMAKAVIGISPTTLGELCEEIQKKGKGNLADSQVQFLMFDEIEHQVSLHLKAINEGKGKGSFAYKQTLGILQLVKKIMEKKESLRAGSYCAQKANSDDTYRRLSY